jgi:hypothetical protein
MNSGEFVLQGTLTDTTSVTIRPALALDGNAGGLPEVFVQNPRTQINIAGATTITIHIWGMISNSGWPLPPK